MEYITMRTFVATILACTLLPGIALAGNATMTNAKTGQSVSVSCQNSGCTMTFSGGGKPSATRTGPGGEQNFNSNVARLRAQGFK